MKLVLCITLGVIFVTLITTTAYFLDHSINGDYYKGKISLTEQEYKDFKIAVADKAVKVEEMTVLSSEPPIVIIFEIRSKENFKYGTESNDDIYFLVLGPLLGIAAGLVVFQFAFQNGQNE